MRVDRQTDGLVDLPFGPLVAPHDGASTGLTADDGKSVREISDVHRRPRRFTGAIAGAACGGVWL
jgi:hypothetical protein